MNWKTILMFASPFCVMAGMQLAAKDANTTGSDDRAATVLKWLPALFTALINDTELPAAPEILQKQR